MANTYLDHFALTQQAVSGKALILPDAVAAIIPFVSGERLVQATGTTVALDPFAAVSQLDLTGTVTLTLAAPTTQAAGFRKRIRVDVAASTPAGTLTITGVDTVTGFIPASVFFFDTVGQEIVLEVTVGGLWRCVDGKRVGTSGANGVVVGTTVLTNKNMWESYNLSVTGTASSTTTKGIPNGSWIGETIFVGCGTAASIPSGTIAITGFTSLEGAATTLGTFNATTCWARLRWDGLGWRLSGASSTRIVLS